ncbi:hypothetical protein C8Q79DRAFT_1002604 [Trametes meyenii]|nr:hypothetical protein C8Q79DRAFT_1002604 [Trametes meyenii]
MANVPAAPVLPGEALIEIFVYPPSLAPNRPLEEGNKFSDSNRLLFLGRQMAETIYIDVLCQKWDRASGQQLKEMVANSFSGFVERTAATYRWSRQVRGYPPNFNMGSLEEAHRLFFTYVGAAYIQHGYQVLRDWIAALVR